MSTVASTCPVCKGVVWDGTGHTCWGWQPMHERGTTVAHGVPPAAWHHPRMGVLVVRVEVPIEMDEYMAAASMEAFGRPEDQPLVEGHRVVSASFVPYERPEIVA